MGPPSTGFEALERLVDIDLSTGQLLHELHPRRVRTGCRPVDAELAQQRVESRSRGRVAHAEVTLQVFHIPARSEEDSQHIAVLVRQNAELAGRKSTRQLRVA